MKALFNLVALVAVAIVFFLWGKTFNQGIKEITINKVDSAALKKSYARIDSLAEANRELEVIIVRQQDSLTETLAEMNAIKKKSDKTYALYVKAKSTYNVPEQLHECDDLIEQYADYRVACEDFVIQSDSIISALYTDNKNKDEIIVEQREIMREVNTQYMDAVLTYERYYNDHKKKRKWQKISAALAALLGVTLLAR